MPDNINVKIVSPGGEIFSGDANSVLVPGSLGQMTILPKHAAILSSLSKGTITVNTTDGKNTNFVIDSGFVENLNNSLTIIIESLEEN
ncbi:MAG: ATP synthase F1 subunit epsilon [Chloroflexota bacterium]|nr:ATP synthase F1 subunit epsilon [Chloroflexota bacterium]